MSKYKVINSDYLRFSIRENGLRIFITKEGREELREYRERVKDDHKNYKSDLVLLLELMEHFLCNGWTVVDAERVGDMRDDDWLVITQDCCEADDRGGKLIVGVAYSYPQYAVESYIDPLVSKGYIDFEKHVYLTEREVEYEIATHRDDVYDPGVRAAILEEANGYYDRMQDTEDHYRAEWAGQQVLAFT